jgi:hypothetical protein
MSIRHLGTRRFNRNWNPLLLRRSCAHLLLLPALLLSSSSMFNSAIRVDHVQ